MLSMKILMIVTKELNISRNKHMERNGIHSRKKNRKRCPERFTQKQIINPLPR
jgi:hypothetical protein